MKRANGTGSVYKLSGKRRKPWAVAISAHDEDGFRTKKFLGYYERQRDALRALDEYNRNPYEIAYTCSLEELYTQWLYEASPGKKDTTVSMWRTCMSHAEPLAKRNFSSLKRADFQKTVDALSGESSQHHQICFYRMLTEYAIKQNIVGSDLAVRALMKNTDKEAGHRESFSQQQVLYLWEHRLDCYEAAVLTLFCFTGLRAREWFEIDNENIHREKRYIDVVDSKTKAGVRQVPIPRKIEPVLDYVLNCPKLHYDQAYRLIRKWMNGNGSFKSRTIHECRHTYVSELYRIEAPKFYIRKMVGHAGGDVTEDTYGHAELAKSIEISDQMYGFLE